eukprot:3935840-Rhodomonas_salina.1
MRQRDLPRCKFYLALGAMDVGSLHGEETASYCSVQVLGGFRAMSDANKVASRALAMPCLCCAPSVADTACDEK